MASRIDLRAMRAFAVVAEERSIRRAAARLHTSQPPLSRLLRSLEVELGGDLLVRAADGVSLTELGHTFLRRSRDVIQEADNLVREIRDHVKHATPVAIRVGVSHALPQEPMRRLNRAWGKALRGRTIRVSRDFAPGIAAALRNGELDFALLTVPGDTTGLTTRALYSERLVAALPKAHPAARRKIVALRDLGDTPFFWNPRSFNPQFFDHCAKVFRSAGFDPRYVTVPPAQVLTLERIGHGEGCTLVNESRRGMRVPGLVYRPLVEADQLAVRMLAAWKPGHLEDVAALLAAAALREIGTPTPSRPGRRG